MGGKEAVTVRRQRQGGCNREADRMHYTRWQEEGENQGEE